MSAPGQGVDLTTTNTTLLQAVQAINNLGQEILGQLTALNTNLLTVFPVTFLTGSKTFDPPSIATGASATTTLTITGAVLGAYVLPAFSLSLAGLTLTAYVSAADTVTFVFGNLTAGAVDLASGTLSAKVLS